MPECRSCGKRRSRRSNSAGTPALRHSGPVAIRHCTCRSSRPCERHTPRRRPSRPRRRPIRWPRRRRSDCGTSATPVPGLRRRRAGKGFRYRGRRRPAGPRPRDPAADQGAGDPAGVDRRLDLPVAPRAHPGHGPRREGAQAVPLPSPLARGARRDQVRPHARLRPRPRAVRAADRRRPGPARACRAKGAGHRRPPAGDDADPRRQRGVRPRQSAPSA